MKLIVAFGNFAKAPKNESHFMSSCRHPQRHEGSKVKIEVTLQLSVISMPNANTNLRPYLGLVFY